MAERIKLEGRRFSRLVVIRYVDRGFYEVRCDCGTIKRVETGQLNRGTTKSCGCFRSEYRSERWSTDLIRHGHSKHGTPSPEYRTWDAMIQRCTNPKHKHWKHYGGRGIRVCAEWRADFAVFLAHIGKKPSPKHSIDRIDNDRGYEPGNVRWATTLQQTANKRRPFYQVRTPELVALAKRLRADGVAFSQLASRFGVSSDSVRNWVKSC